jgi:hypothetical protein
VIPGHPEESPE